MIAAKLKKRSVLYRFLNSKKTSRRILFNEDIWDEALHHLSEFNSPRYFFDFEDRLIEEIVLLIKQFPPDRARAEMIKIKRIVDRERKQHPHVRPFVESIRNAVSGAVSVGLKFLA